MEPRLRRAGEREAKRHRREETRRAGPRREKRRRTGPKREKRRDKREEETIEQGLSLVTRRDVVRHAQRDSGLRVYTHPPRSLPKRTAPCSSCGAGAPSWRRRRPLLGAPSSLLSFRAGSSSPSFSSAARAPPKPRESQRLIARPGPGARTQSRACPGDAVTGRRGGANHPACPSTLPGGSSSSIGSSTPSESSLSLSSPSASSASGPPVPPGRSS